MRRVFTIIISLGLGLAGPALAHDLLQLLTLPNPACVDLVVLPPGSCMLKVGLKLVPGQVVRYWEPRWLVETTRRPGETHVDLFAPLIRAAGAPLMGGGGAGLPQGSLQYFEAHVFTFPLAPPWVFPCTGCASRPLTLHYLSETDPLWRLEVGMRDLGGLGTWGNLYPRIGFVDHPSEPVGAAAAAARALSIANTPEGHVRLSPSLGESRCCQLAEPKRTGCFPVGETPLTWEAGTVHPAGGPYLWVFWNRRECCLPLGALPCGLTFGKGGNRCPP